MFLDNRMAIAVTITGTSLSDIIQRLNEVNDYSVDLIEWRLDPGLASNFIPTQIEMNQIVQATNLPIIMTYRTMEEGGAFPFDVNLYQKLYQDGVSAGIKYLDVEYRHWYVVSKMSKAWRLQTQIILSYHNFSCIPPNLGSIISKMTQIEIDAIKVAVLSHSELETMTFLKQLRHCNDKPLIGIAMGKFGQISRIMGFKYGSRVTYTTLPSQKHLAPGQVGLIELITKIKQL